MKLDTSSRKKFRVRNKLKKFSAHDRFRLSISRSSKNIFAQIIDDSNNVTLLSASSLEKEIKSLNKINKTELSKIVAEKLAKKAKEKKITNPWISKHWAPSNEKIQKSPIIGLKANQNGSLSMIVLDEKFNLERQMDCDHKNFKNFLNTYGLKESQLYEVIAVDKGDSAKLTVRKYNSFSNYRHSLGTFITGMDGIQLGLYSALVVIPTSKMICNCVLDAVHEQYDFPRPEVSPAIPTAVGIFLEYTFYNLLKFIFQLCIKYLFDN